MEAPAGAAHSFYMANDAPSLHGAQWLGALLIVVSIPIVIWAARELRLPRQEWLGGHFRRRARHGRKAHASHRPATRSCQFFHRTDQLLRRSRRRTPPSAGKLVRRA